MMAQTRHLGELCREAPQASANYWKLLWSFFCDLKAVGKREAPLPTTKQKADHRLARQSPAPLDPLEASTADSEGSEQAIPSACAVSGLSKAPQHSRSP